jgi:hypothetical protein
LGVDPIVVGQQHAHALQLTIRDAAATNLFDARPDVGKTETMLLLLAIVLLIIAVAGGVIVHPVIFALAIVALVLFFSGRRGGAVV